MKKKLIAGIWIVIVLLAVIGGIISNLVLKSSPTVNFRDEEMGKLIAQSAGVESVNKFCEEDFEKVTMLNIGYTGYYDTLSDIEKCRQLDTLIIGYPEYMYCRYETKEKKIPEPESKERIQQIEKELGKILEKCPNLRVLCISNENDDFELDSLEFLKGQKNLEALRLEEQSAIDNYSYISECVHLKHLSLYGSNISEISMIQGLEELEGLNLAGTNISEASDILKFKNLKDLAIRNTPLEKNEEELALIYQQFPDIDFY